MSSERGEGIERLEDELDKVRAELHRCNADFWEMNHLWRKTVDQLIEANEEARSLRKQLAAATKDLNEVVAYNKVLNESRERLLDSVYSNLPDLGEEAEQPSVKTDTALTGRIIELEKQLAYMTEEKDKWRYTALDKTNELRELKWK